MTIKKKAVVVVAGACLLPLLIVLTLGAAPPLPPSPGGMRPTDSPKDYTPQLTRKAATGLPLIAALKRYHEEHGYFPAKITALAPYLPSPKPSAARPEWRDWHYTQGKNGATYYLAIGLGWDPTLNYHFDGHHGQWVFNPGDGSDETFLDLNP